jgi:integrase
MGKRLTDNIIRKLTTDKHSAILYDAPNGSRSDFVSGFGVRVTRAGAKSFVLTFRMKDGTQGRYTIGRWPEWSLTAARNEARDLKGQIAQGRNPVKEGKALRDAPTIADLVQRFREEHLPTLKPATQRDYAGLLKLITDEIGSSKVGSLDLADVKKMHYRITQHRGGYRANRAVGVLSSMYGEATTTWKLTERNPCVGVKRNKEQERERYLTDGELARLMVVLDEYHDQRAANFFRLLLWTGARAGETRLATWDRFDLDAGIWHKPASTTKTGKDNSIPLSGPARELLVKIHDSQDAPRSGPVFPGDGPHGELVKYQDHWDRIRKAADILNIRPHDLRHSFASSIASSGFGLPVIGKLLGHSSVNTTKRYSHLVGGILREATEAAGKKLSVVPKKASVTTLHRGKR